MSSDPEQDRCAARVYRYSPERNSASGGAQQRLVDRLSRHHWEACASESSRQCARCMVPLCDAHMHATDRRCPQCETEYRAVHRSHNAGLVLAYCALVFAIGVTSMALGYRLGLVVVIPTLAAAPLIARLGRHGRARRRFLRETRKRAPQVPRAWTKAL